VDASQLPAGESTGAITLRSVTSTLRIPVTVRVTAVPSIAGASPASVAANSQGATVTLTGAGFSAASRAEVNGVPVQTVPVDSRTLRIVLNAELLRTEGTLTIVVTDANERSAPFPLKVLATTPSIAAAGVVSAATWIAGPVAPGQLVIIGGAGFGADPVIEARAAEGYFPTSLAGVRVLVDGEPAPLLWVRSGRVAAQIPYSAAGKPAVRLAVESGGAASEPVNIAVQTAAPGLFTTNSAGNGQAAALNGDGTLNSSQNPAARGSVIVLYGTGEGATVPALPAGTIVPADSRPQPASPVTVTIGGVPATVEYAGGVPGLITGFLQLNVRIPTSAPPGDLVPVVISVGEFPSPGGGVTISVR
jgi:uncharacterized protein (TIGR03437 family)